MRQPGPQISFLGWFFDVRSFVDNVAQSGCLLVASGWGINGINEVEADAESGGLVIEDKVWSKARVGSIGDGELGSSGTLSCLL